jgi:hypothetical protein
MPCFSEQGLNDPLSLQWARRGHEWHDCHNWHNWHDWHERHERHDWHNWRNWHDWHEWHEWHNWRNWHNWHAWHEWHNWDNWTNCCSEEGVTELTKRIAPQGDIGPCCHKRLQSWKGTLCFGAGTTGASGISLFSQQLRLWTGHGRRWQPSKRPGCVDWHEWHDCSSCPSARHVWGQVLFHHILCRHWVPPRLHLAAPGGCTRNVPQNVSGQAFKYFSLCCSM